MVVGTLGIWVRADRANQWIEWEMWETVESIAQNCLIKYVRVVQLWPRRNPKSQQDASFGLTNSDVAHVSEHVLTRTLTMTLWPWPIAIMFCASMAARSPEWAVTKRRQSSMHHECCGQSSKLSPLATFDAKRLSQFSRSYTHTKYGNLLGTTQ